MSKLYSRLAQVYHEMYQTIFNYKNEFQFYDRILKKQGCEKILEIGCGSGNLAPYFTRSGYDYTGLDLFQEMLDIAKRVAPGAKFVRGDMRNLRLHEKFDAVLITGRSFTYMTRNADVQKALKSIHKTLKKNGLFIFDNFNADVMFRHFKKTNIHTAVYNDTKYKRVSKNTMNLETGWTKTWNAKYYITKNGKTTVISDTSILRAFTQDELSLFLHLTGFETLKVIKKGTSLFIISKKSNNVNV